MQRTGCHPAARLHRVTLCGYEGVFCCYESVVAYRCTASRVLHLLFKHPLWHCPPAYYACSLNPTKREHRLEPVKGQVSSPVNRSRCLHRYRGQLAASCDLRNGSGETEERYLSPPTLSVGNLTLAVFAYHFLLNFPGLRKRLATEITNSSTTCFLA